jgi:hypothetical protein
MMPSLIYRLGMENGKTQSNPARLLRRKREDNGRVRFLNQFQPGETETDYLKDCNHEESRLRAVIGRKYQSHLPGFEIAVNLAGEYSVRDQGAGFSLAYLIVDEIHPGRFEIGLRFSDLLRARSSLEFLEPRSEILDITLRLEDLRAVLGVFETHQFLPPVDLVSFSDADPGNLARYLVGDFNLMGAMVYPVAASTVSGPLAAEGIGEGQRRNHVVAKTTAGMAGSHQTHHWFLEARKEP